MGTKEGSRLDAAHPVVLHDNHRTLILGIIFIASLLFVLKESIASSLKVAMAQVESGQGLTCLHTQQEHAGAVMVCGKLPLSNSKDQQFGLGSAG